MGAMLYGQLAVVTGGKQAVLWCCLVSLDMPLTAVWLHAVKAFVAGAYSLELLTAC